MPSANSISSPSDNGPDLAAAATAVAEGTLFAFVDVLDRAAWSGAIQGHEHAEWLSGAVEFRGAAGGTVVVSVPRTLASDLCAAMSGVEPDAVTDGDVADFVGELANMICGGWLTTVRGDETFDLTSPTVSGQTGAALSMGEPGPDQAWLTINDAPALVSLRWSRSAPTEDLS